MGIAPETPVFEAFLDEVNVGFVTICPRLCDGLS